LICMPIIKKPLEVQCFQCSKKFLVRFVPAKKDWSKKKQLRPLNGKRRKQWQGNL
jgi:hypothetical protein